MVYSQYYDNQPPAVPWPVGYEDQDPKREKRSPVLGASIAGLIAVLVMAVGVLLGLQLSRPGMPQPSVQTSAPSIVARPTTSAMPTSPPDTVTRAGEQQPAQDPTRLDRSTYESMTPREFALMAKNPDSWAGRKIVVYGVITQFDAATGATAFRADTGPVPSTERDDYNQNTFITAHDASIVANFVEKDRVTMYVQVQGAYTYNTQIGGSTTVPSLLANVVETTGLGSPPPSYPVLRPSAAPVPAPPPTSESASESQLRSIAAGDQPFVLNGLTDQWVPQLSSKRPGMVAEGSTWSNAMILSEHEQLRQRYPSVRLLWSGDWSTFSDSNFWVTVVGIGFPTADQALAWCANSGLDGGHCYAKLISTTHPVEGSTAYN